MKRQSSPHATPSTIEHKWWLVDAQDQILGRLASHVAALVKGKSHVDASPGMDTGDFVVIVNAEKIKVTGNKEQDKKYYRHSGYPGGLKTTSFIEMKNKTPELILFNAIKGMLPRHKIKYMNKVKIYRGPDHQHSAQSPTVIALDKK